MISQYEFAQYLQDKLDDNTIVTDVQFKVKTPDMPFFDTMARKINSTDDVQTRVLPVMVEQTGEGGYDPVPDLGMWNGTLNVTFMFPLSDLSAMEQLYDYLATLLSGKFDSIGDVSGKCVMAVGQRTFSSMQLLDVGQFSQINEQIMAFYGKEVRMTREWSSMTFAIDFASSKNAGATGGLIYGNEIQRILCFYYKKNNNWTYTQMSIRPIDASSANSIMPFSQQYVGGNETKSIPACSAKGVSFSCYVQDYDAWMYLIQANRTGHLSDDTLVKGFVYQEFFASRALANPSYLFQGDVIITEIGFTGGYGEPLTCSMSLAPKGEVYTL